MTMTALANRWRPRRFDEVIGQEHVTKVLRQAAARGRLQGGFLLMGTRGTGKTTTARIAARAAVCGADPTGEACEACTACEETRNDGAHSLVEIDAATHRTVDEARATAERIEDGALLNQRQVYIIDEAHMLTPPAREVMRQRVEDLPPGTAVILCTTEPESLGDALPTRCQQHRFRRVRNQAIVRRLEEICEAEGIAHQEEALRLIAHAAAGSMRDALTSLEQMASGTIGELDRQSVEQMMGGHFRQNALIIAAQMMRGASDRAASTIRETADDGARPSDIHRQVRETLNDALAVSWGLTRAEDLPQTTRVALEEFKWQDVVSAQTAWLQARPLADDPETTKLERAIDRARAQHE